MKAMVTMIVRKEIEAADEGGIVGRVDAITTTLAVLGCKVEVDTILNLEEEDVSEAVHDSST